MKKGISRWAFPPRMGLKECLDLARRAGFGAEQVIGEEGMITLESDEGLIWEASRSMDLIQGLR